MYAVAEDEFFKNVLKAKWDKFANIVKAHGEVFEKDFGPKKISLNIF